MWAVVRPARVVPQPGFSLGLQGTYPPVEGGPGGPVVAAGRCDVAAHFLGVLDHRKAMPDQALLLTLIHKGFLYSNRETPPP